jgi:hypothetical protein
MATIPIRYLSFLVISCISIASLVYYFSFPWWSFTYDVKFLVLCASLPYTLYMFFYELKSERRLNLEDGLINNNYKIFMIDTYSKYLFPFMFAMLFYSLILNLLTNFSFWEGAGITYYLVNVYVSVILPILTYLDLKTTVRSRNPSPVKDILILTILCIGQCAYRLLVQVITTGKLVIILPMIGDALILAIVTVNAYILYDYTNHANVGGDYYVLFKTNLASPPDNINSIPNYIE